jgi:small GTP-binding protein
MAIIAKICLLGDGMVGKTSLANRYLGKGFSSDYIPTLGSDFTSKEVTIQTDYGSQEFRFQIWDLAGQPSFSQIRSLYYKGATGAFLVFDLTNPDTLESINRWSDEFLRHCKVLNPTMIILGNKNDLSGKIKVSRELVENYIRKKVISTDNNSLQYEFFETSAKTGKNVDKVFNILAKKITNKLM